MGKKKKLRKRVAAVLSPGERALVVCVGKDCAPREESRALLTQLEARYERSSPRADENSPVRVMKIGCLGICKKGPIVAVMPDEKFVKRVHPERSDEALREVLGRPVPEPKKRRKGDEATPARQGLGAQTDH